MLRGGVRSKTPLQTYLCAIVGGVFTVAGIVNGMVQQSTKLVQKTLLGKAE